MNLINLMLNVECLNRAIPAIGLTRIRDYYRKSTKFWHFTWTNYN